MTDDTLEAVRGFIEVFEEVFDKDWAYTKSMLGVKEQTPEQESALAEMGFDSIYKIAPNGTFLNPAVDDEIEDWGNRGLLLERYRRLAKLISK
jgi:hypothetical protein